MDWYTAKQQARRDVQARLDALVNDAYIEATEAVYRNAQTLLSKAHKNSSIKSVLLYRAAVRWREVDLAALKCGFPDIQFTYASIYANATLPAENYDIVFVPLYGFNASGYRLGHGSGWYDKLLTKQPDTLKVGVGLEANRIEFMPESHDVPMDVIITELGAKRLP